MQVFLLKNDLVQFQGALLLFIRETSDGAQRPFARKPIASLEDSEGFPHWKSHPKHGGSEDAFEDKLIEPKPQTHVFWKSFWKLKRKSIETHQKSVDSAKCL